jgi:hypothetical protein
MKDFPKNHARSDEAVDETANTSDQENVAPAQSDAPSVSTQETDLFANAIKLPSESSGARKILKSSAVRASGQIIFGTNPGRLIQLESYLEYKAVLILLAQPDLADLHDQVCFEWFDQAGKSHNHFFDFVTASTTGEKTAVMVKEASRLKSERLQREIKMISKQAVPDFVDRVIVVTQRDIDPVDLHNAKLLHDVRRADLEADDAAERVIAGLIGAVTVCNLVAAIKMGSRGFRAVVRLIRSRSLETVQHEILSYETMVRRAG